MTHFSAQSVQPDVAEKLPGLLAQLRVGLIVSCQAEVGEPLYGSSHVAAVAGNHCGYDKLSIHHPQSLDLRVLRDFNLSKIHQLAPFGFQSLKLNRQGWKITLERIDRAMVG